MDPDQLKPMMTLHQNSGPEIHRNKLNQIRKMLDLQTKSTNIFNQLMSPMTSQNATLVSLKVHHIFLGSIKLSTNNISTHQLANKVGKISWMCSTTDQIIWR